MITEAELKAYAVDIPNDIQAIMKKRFTLKMYYDDMGSFTQPGCHSLEDALWHVNSARTHDGLPAMNLDCLRSLIRSKSVAAKGWAKFTEDYA